MRYLYHWVSENRFCRKPGLCDEVFSETEYPGFGTADYRADTNVRSTIMYV